MSTKYQILFQRFGYFAEVAHTFDKADVARAFLDNINDRLAAGQRFIQVEDTIFNTADVERVYIEPVES